MDELYKDLIKYLEDNFLSFNALDNYIIEIDGQTFELFEPFQWDKEDNGIFFDDSFQWVGDRTECTLIPIG